MLDAKFEAAEAIEILSDAEDVQEGEEGEGGGGGGERRSGGLTEAARGRAESRNADLKPSNLTGDQKKRMETNRRAALARQKQRAKGGDAGGGS